MFKKYFYIWGWILKILKCRDEFGYLEYKYKNRIIRILKFSLEIKLKLIVEGIV